MDVAEAVTAVVRAHPAVTAVDLVGSQADGTATPLSDWDFLIEAVDLDALVRDLPQLVKRLSPLSAQWDRLCDRAVYMLMLPGGIKVDLFPGNVPREIEPPWRPDAGNLSDIDAHFWDWMLWLGSKALGEHDDLVDEELQKLHVNLLGPLGATRSPASVAEAVEHYLELRRRAEARFGVVVDRRIGDAVMARLRKERVVD